MTEIIAFCDGCSKNNGSANARAGSGFVIYQGSAEVEASKLQSQKIIKKIVEGSEDVRKYLPKSIFDLATPVTNNTAEWLSLYLCLSAIAKIPNLSQIQKISVFMDSNLVIEQIIGRWAVKQPHLKPFLTSCKDILRKIPTNVSFAHIYREFNQEADRLSNQAIE